MEALERTLPETLGKRLRALKKFKRGSDFCVGDIEVHAFAIPHDAADPIDSRFAQTA